MKKLLIVLKKIPTWIAVGIGGVLYVLIGFGSFLPVSEYSVPDYEEQVQIKQMLIEDFFDHPGRRYLSKLNPGQSKVQVFEVMSGWAGSHPEMSAELAMEVDSSVWREVREVWDSLVLVIGKPKRTDEYEAAQGQIEVLYYNTGVEQPLTNDELMAMEYVDFVNYCKKLEVPPLPGHEDDRVTPIVLLKDSLVGWGWDFWEDLAIKYEIRIR